MGAVKKPDHSTESSGNAAADVVRRAAMWFSAPILATAIVVSQAVNDQRDIEEVRETHRRDVTELRTQLDRITRDLTDRLQFVDRDGIRDPVVRLALDQYIARFLKEANVLTHQWAIRLKDINPTFSLPKKEE